MNVTMEADLSVDPRTAAELGAVAHTHHGAVTDLVRRAAAVAEQLSTTAPSERARWLNSVADALLVHHEELALLADTETALGLPRLRSEIAGAATSARFYASVAVDGLYLGASSDTVNETTTLSRWNVPVGPVAVFGASNFPFGFGVFGHDVASAIAAGCPVVVKAHPAHPRLSVRLAEIVVDALATAGAPEGLYGLVVGFEAGVQIVDAPEIRAVAFTGSQRGGMALLERGARRGVPVFAEMGTVNPVFVTREAVHNPEQVESIATGFVASFTLGAGQFCTKPGLMFAPSGSGMRAAVSRAVALVEPAPLLTAGIAEHFTSGVGELEAASSSAAVDAEDDAKASTSAQAGTWASSRLVSVNLDDLQPQSRLLEECFGPVALLCEYDDADTAVGALLNLQGSLVASVFIGDDTGETRQARELVTQLSSRVGRVAVNAWPTGVANTWSQHHGGPWPAASRTEATSVGAGALQRFVRPVTLQNARPGMVPDALHPDNPWNIPRRIDGVLTVPEPRTANPKANS